MAGKKDKTIVNDETIVEETPVQEWLTDSQVLAYIKEKTLAGNNPFKERIATLLTECIEKLK